MKKKLFIFTASKFLFKITAQSPWYIHTDNSYFWKGSFFKQEEHCYLLSSLALLNFAAAITGPQLVVLRDFWLLWQVPKAAKQSYQSHPTLLPYYICALLINLLMISVIYIQFRYTNHIKLVKASWDMHE